MIAELTPQDIAELRAQGDLAEYLRLLTGRAPKPKPRLAAVPEPAYRIAHPGAWPLGTTATGPTPPPDACSCPKCKQQPAAAPSA